jgi:hypothetical protein
MLGELARHYSWRHDFWRQIGWRSLRGYLEAMNRQRSGGEPDPEKWTPASRAHFDQMRAEREGREGH